MENREKDPLYLNVVPPTNDGQTVYKLIAKDVPVDGFWSVSLYNADGYLQKNELDAYTVNNVTAKKEADVRIGPRAEGPPGGIFRGT